MDDPKKLEIFKHIGLDTSRMWFLYDDNYQGFFDWFTSNITEENIVGDSELKEFADLEKDGLVLSEEHIAIEMEQLDVEYPSILKYRDADVSQLEEQLDELVSVEELYENMVESAKKTDKSLSKEISSLETQMIDEDYLLKQISAQCLQKANYLQEIQENNQKKLNAVHQCYVRPQNPSLFIYQMPIDQYTGKCDLFIKYLEISMRKHFLIKDPDDPDEALTDHSELSNQLDSINARLYSAATKILEEDSNLDGIKAIIRKLNTRNWQPMKFSAMKKLNAELKAKNDQDLLRIDAMKQDYDLLLKQTIEQKIELVLYENSKQKLERAQSRLEIIQELSNIISNVLNVADMMWILMQLDLEKIKDKFDNSEEMNSESQKCLKRMELMRNIDKMNADEEVLNNFISQFVSLVSSVNLNTSAKSRSMSFKICLEDFANYKKALPKRLDAIVKKKHYKNVNETLEKLSQNEAFLSQYVFDGPINTPQLFGPNYLDRTQRASYNKEKIEKMVKQLKNEMVQNIFELKTSKKFWVYHRQLWIWFLTEPKKVVTVINEISAAASKSASFKSISGIKLKPTKD